MIEARWEGYLKAFVPVCDSCGDELDPEYRFLDAVDAVKDAGWHSSHLFGEWQNYCAECCRKQSGAAADFADIRR